MTRRPLTLTAAVILMLVIGSGIAFVGALLLVVATGGIAFLTPGGTAGAVALLGGTALVIAAATFAGAAGLWLRRPWGWAASAAIALASVVGAIVAVQTSGSQAPVIAGLALTLAAAASLLAPSTRTASGIG